MAKKKERTEFKKQNYVNNFQLVGKVRLTDNSFQIDNQSQKSNWTYSRANFGIDCGPDHGLIFVQAMGGFSNVGDSTIYAHGKDSNNRDDFNVRLNVNWSDRLNPEIVEQAGRMSLVSAGLEKDTKGKIFYKNYLSKYDLVEYMSEHLQDGMTVYVRGDIRYQFYNDGTTCNYELTSIALSDAEEDGYYAKFTQTLLLDADSKGEIDKENGEIDITGYALEYLKDYRGVDITDKDGRGQVVPIPYNFKYKISEEMKKNPDIAKKAISKLFSMKKKDSVSQITFEGVCVSTGATVTLTSADLPDDLKELITLSIMTEEEAIASCATNGNRERKMVLLRPRVRMVNNDDGSSSPQVQIFEDMYSVEDLDYFRTMSKPEEPEPMEDGDMNAPEEVDEVEFDGEKKDGEQWDWLNDL